MQLWRTMMQEATTPDLSILEVIKALTRPSPPSSSNAPLPGPLSHAVVAGSEKYTVAALTNNFAKPEGTKEGDEEAMGSSEMLKPLFHHYIESAKVGLRYGCTLPFLRGRSDDAMWGREHAGNRTPSSSGTRWTCWQSGRRRPSSWMTLGARISLHPRFALGILPAADAHDARVVLRLNLKAAQKLGMNTIRELSALVALDYSRGHFALTLARSEPRFVGVDIYDSGPAIDKLKAFVPDVDLSVAKQQVRAKL